jgi:predicted metalloprotease
VAVWNQEWSAWAATTLAENAGYWKPILGPKFRPPRIRFLQEKAIDTACGSLDTSESAMYCPLDETIYVDALFLQQQEQTFGAHAAQLIVDHEYGHHIQNLQGLDWMGMQSELQADCLAGAAIASQSTAEELDLSSLGRTLVTTTEAAGDPSLLDDSHGTPYERVMAVADGITDLSRCDLTGDGHYYPVTQL